MKSLIITLLIITSSISTIPLFAKNPSILQKTENNQGLIGSSISLGVHGSIIKGVGASVGYNLLPIIHLNVGYSHFKVSNTSGIAKQLLNDFETGGTEIEANLSSFDIMAEIYPFATASSFNITVGAHIMPNDFISITGEIDAGKTFDYGDIEGIPDALSTSNNISAKIKTNTIAPYIGIGLGRAVPKRRIGFGVKAGVFFVGKPEAELSASNVEFSINGNTANLEAAEEEFNKESEKLPITVLPSISFRVMVKIKK